MLAFGLAILVFLAISLTALGVAGRTRNPLQARIRTLAAAARSENIPDLERPFVERAVWPVLEGLSERVMSLLPAALLARLRQQLTLAGSSLNVRGFILIWIASAAAFPGAFLVLMLTAQATSGALYFMGSLTSLALGIYLP